MNILIADSDFPSVQELERQLYEAGHSICRKGSVNNAADFDLSIAGATDEHHAVLLDLAQQLAALKLDHAACSPFVARFQDEHYLITLPSCRRALSAVSRHLVNVCGSHLPTASQDHFNTAVCEALQNALIHGNLEVSSKLRDTGDWDAYEALIGARLSQPEYAQRRIHIDAQCGEQQLTIKVQDDGPGFNPADLPDPLEPDALLRASGRGIAMIRFAMDEVSWNERGNCIEMTKYVTAA